MTTTTRATDLVVIGSTTAQAQHWAYILRARLDLDGLPPTNPPAQPPRRDPLDDRDTENQMFGGK